MAAPGRFFGQEWGIRDLLRVWGANTGTGTFVMASLNTGCCFRFMATDTRDISSLYINWSSVSSPGQFSVRIETIDATTGKPSGTLVDANATATGQTPTAGWQQVTLGSTPWSSHMVAGTEYAVVILITTGGTTQTLRHMTSASADGVSPAKALTAADGTTRSNFTEVANSIPVCTLVMSDAVEEVLNFCPFATANTQNIFGTAGVATKLVVPTGMTFTVNGYVIGTLNKTGTPAGDLRARIFSGSSVVSGSTVTIDKDSILTASNARAQFHPFQTPLSLSAGSYYVALDSGSSANSSNCWKLTSAAARAAGNVPSGAILSTTADITAGTISWSDDATQQLPLGIVLDNITATGSAPVTLGF